MSEGRDPNTSEGTEERRDRVARELEESLLNESFFHRRSTVSDASVEGAWTGRDIGDEVGEFRLMNMLGRGGMGQVWEAEQPSMGRRVALKLLHAHIQFSADGVARFQREARAGGKLTHPGIVQVYAVGEHEGIHYMAQELVQGSCTFADTLADFRKGDELPEGYYRHIAELFATIAEALEHAHSNGVIHRDIKPANLLIGSDDRPKVADFGLAMVEDQLGLSRTGDFMGTPFYMSPEQAASKRMGIDHRTDIFSLGATLYEALTLVRPFAGDTSQQVFQQILVVDPPDPKELRSRVPQDLAVICLKALEKNQDQRFESMEAFARDLRRYLNDEPILAKPPTPTQRAMKWVRRNPTKSAVAGVTAAAFVVISGLLLQNVRTNAALEEEKGKLVNANDRLEEQTAALELSNEELGNKRREAELLYESALSLSQQVEESNERLRVQKEEAEHVAEFQAEQLAQIDASTMGLSIKSDVLERARAVGVMRGRAPDVLEREAAELARLLGGADFTGLARDALDEHVFEGALDALEEFEDQPLVKASLLQTLAHTMREVGLLDRAEIPQREALRLREEELGAEDPFTLESAAHLGRLLHHQSKLEEAEAQHRRALAGRSERFGEEAPETYESLHDLAFTLYERGKMEASKEHYLRALEGRERLLGEGDQRTLETRSYFGLMLLQGGEFDDAELQLRRALEGQRRTLGDDDIDTIITLSNLGLLLHHQERLDEAAECYAESLERYRKNLGEDHPFSLTVLGNLGAVLHAQGDKEQAMRYFRLSLEGQRRVSGDDHRRTLSSMYNLAFTYKEMGELDEAERLMREAAEGYQRTLGEEHYETLSVVSHFADFLDERGKEAEAAALYQGIWETYHRLEGASHGKTLSNLHRTVDLFLRAGLVERAHELALQLVRETPLDSGGRKSSVSILEEVEAALGVGDSGAGAGG